MKNFNFLQREKGKLRTLKCKCFYNNDNLYHNFILFICLEPFTFRKHARVRKIFFNHIGRKRNPNTIITQMWPNCERFVAECNCYCHHSCQKHDESHPSHCEVVMSDFVTYWYSKKIGNGNFTVWLRSDGHLRVLMWRNKEVTTSDHCDVISTGCGIELFQLMWQPNNST